MATIDPGTNSAGEHPDREAPPDALPTPPDVDGLRNERVHLYIDEIFPPRHGGGEPEDEQKGLETGEVRLHG
jgi:hypothetical protein